MILSVLKYIFLFILAKIMDLLNIFLAPVVVLFAKPDADGKHWLPRWLWWFQTPDNPLEGDQGWIEEHRWFKVEDASWKRYLNMVGWLYRNSTYGFAIDVIGITLPEGFIYTTKGNNKARNRPTLRNGKVFYTITFPDGRFYWQFYYVRGWGTKGRCIRINCGWKIWEKPSVGQKCQHVFSANPFMGAGPLDDGTGPD